MFLSKESQWKALVERLSTEEYIGLDTEFEGVDFKAGNSCVNRAKVDLYSIAVFSGELSPRGYRKATGCVLPPESIPYLKEVLENPTICKVLHNSNVDVHAFYNVGVDTQNVVNTLSLARWMFPDRLLYNLEDLCQDYLGTGKTESFKDIFIEDVMEPFAVNKILTVCECLVDGCRKRKGPHAKTKVEHTEYEDRKVGTRIVPLHTVRPGHYLWDRYVAYAKFDAIRALELFDYMKTVEWSTEVLWYEQK